MYSQCAQKKEAPLIVGSYSTFCAMQRIVYLLTTKSDCDVEPILDVEHCLKSGLRLRCRWRQNGDILEAVETPWGIIKTEIYEPHEHPKRLLKLNAIKNCPRRTLSWTQPGIPDEYTYNILSIDHNQIPSVQELKIGEKPKFLALKKQWEKYEHRYQKELDALLQKKKSY